MRITIALGMHARIAHAHIRDLLGPSHAVERSFRAGSMSPGILDEVEFGPRVEVAEMRAHPVLTVLTCPYLQ